MEPILERCQLCQPAHTTIIRGKTSNRVDSGKGSNHRRITGGWDTRISTILRAGYRWISRRTRERGRKDSSSLSSPKSGRTATNVIGRPVGLEGERNVTCERVGLQAIGCLEFYDFQEWNGMEWPLPCPALPCAWRLYFMIFGVGVDVT